MKKQTGIWIDKTEAIIVTFIGNNHTIKRIKSNSENRYNTDSNESGSWKGGQHLSDERKIEERQRNRIQQYLNEILLFINDVQELYLFGPAGIKLEFEKKLNNENKLPFKLLKTETADSMTENQVVAQVRLFFKLT